MKRVISFSLWGTEAVYLSGALTALDSAKKFFPGWEYWYYVRNDVPETIKSDLQSAGARLIGCDFRQAFSGMVLRFLPASDPDVEVMLSRDVDSLISSREAAAVNQWLSGDKDFHIIRDHPSHILPIMGGLWGCRNGVISAMNTLLETHYCFHRYGSDQKFLAHHVYPRIRNNCCVHSEMVRLSGEDVMPFPVERIGIDFIARANRTGFDQSQDRQMEQWVNDGKPLVTVPNIYSLSGRLWLAAKRLRLI